MPPGTPSSAPCTSSRAARIRTGRTSDNANHTATQEQAMPHDPSHIGTSDFSGGGQSRSPINRSEEIDRPSTAGAHADRPAWASEDEYWRNNYGSRPYARADLAYEHYQP